MLLASSQLPAGIYSGEKMTICIMQERSNAVVSRIMVVATMMMLMLVLMSITGGKAKVVGEGGEKEEEEDKGCLGSCLEGCKHSGISPLRCFKYCESHCAGSTSSPANEHHQPQPSPPSPPPPGHHYCTLGCMLEKCSKFLDDEAKEEACALDCQTNVCKPAN